MDRIRMFYSSIDTKPRVLITHFTRFFGFYVDGITNKDNAVSCDVESMIDIYIISDAYVNERTTNIEVKEEDKSILIYLDGWGTDDLPDIPAIDYDGLSDGDFLRKLSHHMLSIISRKPDRHKRLIDSVDNLKQLIDIFIQQYTDNDILQVTLFARCFRAHRKFYSVAQMKYLQLISQLIQMEIADASSDLIKYISIRSRYEVDLICKVNNYALIFNPLSLQEKCGDLLKKYVDNEALHILQADIDFKLNKVWNKAGNEYADIRLVDCAYTYLQQGNILRGYVRDLDAALNAYMTAVQKKEDYFIVWFRIGECYEKQGKYKNAIDAFEKVCRVLWGRYNRHVLAPPEIIYMHRAVMKIVEINEQKIKNYSLAMRYRELSNNISNEINCDGYFKLIWEDEQAYEKYFPLVQEVMRSAIEKYQ